MVKVHLLVQVPTMKQKQSSNVYLDSEEFGNEKQVYHIILKYPQHYNHKYCIWIHTIDIIPLNIDCEYHNLH